MDIKECVNILAARKTCDGHGHDHDHAGCEHAEQHVPANVNPESEVKGQVIDMSKDEEQAQVEYEQRVSKHVSDVDKLFAAALPQDAKPDCGNADSKLDKFSLVRLSLQAQEYRTKVYKAFDHLFKWVCEDLERHAVYGHGVKRVTEPFKHASALVMKCVQAANMDSEFCSAKESSKDMITLGAELKEYSEILQRLQRIEQRHLTTVAAYHADTLKASREKAQYLRSESGFNAEATGLQLKQKMVVIRQEVEECVSELKGSGLFMRMTESDIPHSEPELDEEAVRKLPRPQKDL